MNNSQNSILPPGLLFSVAGARGIVGKSLDAGIVTRLTLAFCAILKPGPVVTGRDTRPSGEEFESAAAKAIISSGRECIALGIATTPTVEMMVEKLGAAGGIVVTASHNPIEWNALKFLDHRGTIITKELSNKLYHELRNVTQTQAEAGASIVPKNYHQASQDHINAILSLECINPDIIEKRRYKVALDCINGAGSVIAPKLLEELGVMVIRINCRADGDFNRDPEPCPENLGELVKGVEKEEADIGFALDPDADRLALVDRTRGALSEEYTLALAVDYILSRQKGPIVVNMSTSSIIEQIAAKQGSKVTRTPVGEAHVVKAMLQNDAIIGGEGNGGVILPALHPGRDGLLAMALILQFLAERGLSLAEMISTYPPFVIVKKKIPLGGKFDMEELKVLIEAQNPRKIDAGDGVRVTFDDGWYHVRISNTEGIVRIIAESATEERTQKLVKRARTTLDTLWRKA